MEEFLKRVWSLTNSSSCINSVLEGALKVPILTQLSAELRVTNKFGRVGRGWGGIQILWKVVTNWDLAAVQLTTRLHTALRTGPGYPNSCRSSLADIGLK